MKNFLFHRVSNEIDPFWPPMNESLFEKCIQYIVKNYEVQLLENIDFSNFQNHNKVATIMFDDGYLDNYEHAFPILEKYKCKASFYIVTDSIENGSLTWTHELEYIFQTFRFDELHLDFDFLDNFFKSNSFKNWQEQKSFFNKFKPYLKTIDDEKREIICDYLKEYSKIYEFPKLMMNWNQLIELKNSGHYIGSHTVSHRMLGNIKDDVIIKNELRNSREIIFEKLGYYPKTISYPIGSYNENVKTISKDCGFELGLAVKQEFVLDISNLDLFEIPRVELYNESWLKTYLRITGVLEKIKKYL